MSLKGESNPAHKLTEKDVRYIKVLLRNNISGYRIAQKYKVSPRAIYSIKYGETWSHVS